jgi:tRNA-Thr(GGU) m(6)t(6)A37 methyltransferase TsaA
MKRDYFTIRPIGKILTPFKRHSQCPRQGGPAGVEGEAVLNEDLLPALKDLESCTHIILLSWFHLAERDRLQTKTPDGPEIHGTFATRSHNRPNPIGFHVVELLGIEGNRLRVRGLDCLDGTPLIDIKPYFGKLDSIPEAVVGWREQMKKRNNDSF